MEDEKTNNVAEQEELPTAEELEPNAEQLKEVREKRIKFIEEAMPVLEKERQYQITLAEIEEAKYRRLVAMIRHTELMLPPQGEDEPNPVEPGTGSPPADPGHTASFNKKRELKKD